MTLQEFIDQVRAERKIAAARHAEQLSDAELERIHAELVSEWNRWQQEDLLDHIDAVRKEYSRRRYVGINGV